MSTAQTLEGMAERLHQRWQIVVLDRLDSDLATALHLANRLGPTVLLSPEGQALAVGLSGRWGKGPWRVCGSGQRFRTAWQVLDHFARTK